MKIEFKPQALTVTIKPQRFDFSVGNPIARDFVDRDPYDGNYTIIPSAETQILQTKNLRMTDNLTIEPIPQNYGLITWDGSTLLVS